MKMRKIEEDGRSIPWIWTSVCTGIQSAATGQIQAPSAATGLVLHRIPVSCSRRRKQEGAKAVSPPHLSAAALWATAPRPAASHAAAPRPAHSPPDPRLGFASEEPGSSQSGRRRTSARRISRRCRDGGHAPRPATPLRLAGSHAAKRRRGRPRRSQERKGDGARCSVEKGTE